MARCSGGTGCPSEISIIAILASRSHVMTAVYTVWTQPAARSKGEN